MSEVKKRIKKYQKIIEKQKNKKILINVFYSSQPKYCDIISSSLSVGTFNFSNMISVISNSS